MAGVFTRVTNLLSTLSVCHNCQRGLIYSGKKGVSRDLIAKIQQPIDLSLPAIKRWVAKTKWKEIKQQQMYIEDRHDILGGSLATAHFVIAQGGAAKFVDYDRWFEKDSDGKIPLPNRYVEGYMLEAIDASKTNMMYESFDNFKNLDHLKYLKLSECPHIDDWCLDHFVEFRNTLLHLDISGCPQITERGLACLHRLHKLKRLVIHDLPGVKNKGLVALMLEENLPDCVIHGVDFSAPNVPDTTNTVSTKDNPFLHSAQEEPELLHSDEREVIS